MAPNPAATRTEWDWLSLSADDVVLLEVAETPESMRTKIWQLVRAMSLGPEGFRSPKVCVVWLNGDQRKFEAAAQAVRDGLCESMFPGDVPLFGLWTPCRDVYDEIVVMKTDIAVIKNGIADIKTAIADIKTAIAGIKSGIADIRTAIARIAEKVDAMVARIDAMFARFNEKLDAAIATFGEKLDALLQRRLQ